jgi:hypothetical protein
MPDQPRHTQSDDVAVFGTASPSGVTADVIRKLKDKYGLDIKVRSSVAAIDSSPAPPRAS